SIREEDAKAYPFLNAPYAFGVARIEPENNIHLLLEAFRAHRDLPLVIVGNWNRSDYGRQLRRQYAGCENIHILDPIYEPSHLNLLRSNAKVYLHGHSAGGTNPSLVEAMYLGLPILSYDVIYNRITTEHKAMYFTDTMDLQLQLIKLSSADLHNCSLAMQRIARRRYRWSVIANKYCKLVQNEAPQLMPIFDFELPHSLQKSPFRMALRA
ncbi:MAG: glycosyltransferase, partial [Bacteroidota bacterium]